MSDRPLPCGRNIVWVSLFLIAAMSLSKLSFTVFVAEPITFFRRNRRMARSPQPTAAVATDAVLPTWVEPQLTRLVTEAPSGDEWAHELKFDGYRLHARLDRGVVRLQTRTGLGWTGKYPAIAAAVKTLPARQAYLDGELCGVRPDGVTSFALIQNAADRRGGADLVYLLFDLLHLDGLNLIPLPLADRKARLAALIERRNDAIRYSDHQIGQGPAFHRHACALGVEGIVSKRLDAPYTPGDRGLWLKTKCLNRKEFVVVGWTDPEGSPFPRQSPARCRRLTGLTDHTGSRRELNAAKRSVAPDVAPTLRQSERAGPFPT